MSPYIVAGYSVTLVVLCLYALWLASRERRARRRLGLHAVTSSRPAALQGDAGASEVR